MQGGKALIIGAGGFLADFIAGSFRARRYKTVGIGVGSSGGPSPVYDRRLVLRLPDPRLSALLTELEPSVCVNAAGSAQPDLSFRESTLDFEKNTALNFWLLEQIRHFAPRCRYIQLSSAAVYGDPEKLPISEETPLRPVSPYGFHKWQSEISVLEYVRVHSLAAVTARIFSAYGPGLRRQIVWDLCQKALAQPKFSVRGTGQESRDFIHASDVGEAIVTLAQRAAFQGEVYNVASGEETPIREIAELIVKALGRNSQFHFEGATANATPKRWHADISKLRKLGFVPRVSLEKGIHDTVGWVRAQIPPSKITA